MYSSTLSSTLALEGVGSQRHSKANLTPGKRAGTHFTGDWMGSRTIVDGCGLSRPHGI